MGTAASIPGQEGFHEFPDDPQIHSRRSANQSSRTTNSRSVRAMALANHSRQENSYIHADSISSHLLGRGSRRIDNEDIEFPKQFTERGEGSVSNLKNDYNSRNHYNRRQSHEPTLPTVPSISNIPVADCDSGHVSKQLSGCTIASTSPPSSPKAQVEEEKSTPPLQSLSMFRSNMKLTLNLGGGDEAESEWPIMANDLHVRFWSNSSYTTQFSIIVYNRYLTMRENMMLIWT